MSSSDVINIVPETVQDFGACYSRGEINWDSEWGKINKLQGALDSTRGYKINNKWKTDASKQQLDCSLDSVRQRIETATNKYQALVDTIRYAGEQYLEVETLIATHFGGSVTKRSTNESGYKNYLNWYNQCKQRYGDNLLTQIMGSDLGQGIGAAVFGTVNDLSNPLNFATTLFCGGWAKAFAIPVLSAIAISGAKALGFEEKGYRIVGCVNNAYKLYSSGKSLKGAYNALSKADHFVNVTGHKFSEIKSAKAKSYMGTQLYEFTTKSWSLYRSAPNAIKTLGSNIAFQSSNANRFLQSW